VAAAPAEAASRFERIAGVKSAGTPAKYDKVGILEFGKKSARNVLVLNPGTSASAAHRATGGTGSWGLLGPPGGDVTDVAASPTAAGARRCRNSTPSIRRCWSGRR